jgi:hypothetical protein
MVRDSISGKKCILALAVIAACGMPDFLGKPSDNRGYTATQTCLFSLQVGSIAGFFLGAETMKPVQSFFARLSSQRLIWWLLAIWLGYSAGALAWLQQSQMPDTFCSAQRR